MRVEAAAAPSGARLLCGTLLGVRPVGSPGSDEPALLSEDTVACTPDEASAGTDLQAWVQLPCPAGGLCCLSLSAATQQLPTQDEPVPCNQVWRTRRSSGIGSSTSLVSSCIAAQQLAQPSGTDGAQGPGKATWATFTWASGRPVSVTEQAAASGLQFMSQAAQDTGHAMPTTHALQSSGMSATEARAAKWPRPPDPLTVALEAAQREVQRPRYLQAGEGDTDAWAAAHGGIWEVHTLRGLIRQAYVPLPPEWLTMAL